MLGTGPNARRALTFKKFAPTIKRKTDSKFGRNSASFFFRFNLIFIDIFDKVRPSNCTFPTEEGRAEMAKKVGPYIGVTGFMSRDEVSGALAMVPQRSARRLMVGVLMSSKTLAGQQNKWPGRYPKKEAVADIFVDDPRVLNLIHYNTDHSETLLTQLVEITELAGPHLDGFQLNIAWPPISQLEDYQETYPDKFLILQIGGKAMAQAESMERFAQLVGAYLPMIGAILIDSSGGKGEPLDAVKGAEYLWAVREYPTLGVGIAGGLGPETLYLLGALVKEFPDLSIDAESRLRTPKPEDALCLGAMRTYLDGAFRITDGVGS